jgi:hypothetical protein
MSSKFGDANGVFSRYWHSIICGKNKLLARAKWVDYEGLD